MNKKYLRKNIYVTTEDLELLRARRGYRLSDSELYRRGLSLLPVKPLSMEEVLVDLGKQPFDVCPEHGDSFFSSCWKKHA